MFQIAREIHFCYGHRLMHYEGKCRHLHGHNGKAVIVLRASGLDGRGMVLDFSEIRDVVRRWIDEQLDHRMLLSRDDPAVPMLKELGEPVFVMDVNPTAENIAKLIYDYMVAQRLPVAEVQLWETPSCCAVYSGPTG